jgi:PTS system nitrogen regulatory IIA component
LDLPGSFVVQDFSADSRSEGAQDVCRTLCFLDTILLKPLQSQRSSPDEPNRGKSMRLSNYLREDLILHNLDAQDGPGALRVLGDLFQEGGYVTSEEEPFRALMAREESHTTCLGHRIAVPHATIPELAEPLLLVATTKDPIPFGPPETEPVEIFFVLLSPPGRQGDHIKLLARICRLAQHPEDLEDLRQATDTGSLFQALLQMDSRHV